MRIKTINRYLLLLFLLFFSIISTADYSFGAFLDKGWGVRPVSMGGAFTGVADDANAPLWNPAGICQIENHQLSFMYGKPYWGLDNVDLEYNYFSYLLPYSEFTAFGLSWTNFSSENQYNENTLNLSIAQKLYFPVLSSLSGDTIELLTGINIKRISHKYILDEDTEDDPVFSDKNSCSEYDLDVGVLAHYPNGLSMGVCVKHMLQPNIGMKDVDKVPMDMHLGLSKGFWGKLLTALDVSYRDRICNYHIGLEGDVVSNKMVMRTGANLREASIGFGYLYNLENGLKLSFDYAFMFPFKLEEKAGSHRVSLNMQFGQRIKKDVIEDRGRFRL